MAFLHVPNVSIKGLSACVPKTILENSDLSIFTPEESEKFMAATGVKHRRIADPDVCTSDLCYHAAERLISDLGWAKYEIDCLIFATQTPDYILPATSSKQTKSKNRNIGFGYFIRLFRLDLWS